MSDIIFNLILKIISLNFIDDIKNYIKINLLKVLQEFRLDIRVLKESKIGVVKGLPKYSFDNIDILYNQKLKILDEASDVNVYTHIFKSL